MRFRRVERSPQSPQRERPQAQGSPRRPARMAVAAKQPTKEEAITAIAMADWSASLAGTGSVPPSQAGSCNPPRIVKEASQLGLDRTRKKSF
jgi:hypothetical protein